MIVVVTTQTLNKRDVVSIDGDLYQVTGSVGDGYTLEWVEWDEGQADDAVEFRHDQVRAYSNSDE